MELHYNHPRPETVVMMASTFQNHQFNREKINWTRNGHRTLEYSRILEEPSKWSRASTGGLTGANSPFSESPSKQIDDDVIHSTNPYPNQWEMVSAYRANRFRKRHPNFQQTDYTKVDQIPGYTKVDQIPGQPMALIKNGYYKEFLAANAFKKNSVQVNHDRSNLERLKNGTQVNEYNCMVSDRGPVHKKIRGGEVSQANDQSRSSSVSAFTAFNCKGKHKLCTLEERLRTLPPPPPLVKVDKTKPNLQEMPRTSKPGEVRNNPNSQHRVPKNSRNMPKQQDINNVSKSRNNGTPHSTRGTMAFRETRNIPANRGIEDTPRFQVNGALQGARDTTRFDGTESIFVKHPNEDAMVSQLQTLPVRRYVGRDGMVYVAMSSLYNPNIPTQQNIQAITNPPRPQERQLSTRFQDIPVISKSRNTPCSNRPKVLRQTPKHQETYPTIKQALIHNETQIRSQFQNAMDAREEREAQKTPNSDIIVISDSPPPCQAHEMTQRAMCHHYSLDNELHYLHKQTSKQLTKKCYCRCKSCRHHVAGQPSPVSSFKSCPTSHIQQHTLQSSLSTSSSSSVPPPLSSLSSLPPRQSSSSLPPPLSSSSVPPSLSSLSPSRSSSSLPPPPPSSSSSLPPLLLSTTMPTSSKIPHSTFYSKKSTHYVHPLVSQSNSSQSNMVVTSMKNNVLDNDNSRQYFQTPPSSVSNPQFTSQMSKRLHQQTDSSINFQEEIQPKAKLPKAPSLHKIQPRYDHNKNEVLPQQKPARRMTYPQATQMNETHSKTTLKRTYSNSNGGGVLSKEMLLQVPIEDDKDNAKSYGGYAYDHESLPIIVAVHSIMDELHTQNHKDTIEKDKSDASDNSGIDQTIQTSLEVPKHCLTMTQNRPAMASTTTTTVNRDARISSQNDENTKSTKLTGDTEVDGKTTQSLRNSDEPNSYLVQQNMNLDFSKASSGLVALAPKPPNDTETEETSLSNLTTDVGPITTQFKNTDDVPETAASSTDKKGKLSKTYKNHWFKANKSLIKKTDDESKKPERSENLVARLSKKIIETRQKIENETIDWKKKLLCKLELVLFKRLRKAEVSTGVKATIELPTQESQKEKQVKTNHKTSLHDKKKQEQKIATDVKNNETKEPKTTKKREQKTAKDVKNNVAQEPKTAKKHLIKKHRKLRKISVNQTSEVDEQMSDGELTIEETQGSREAETIAENRFTDNTKLC